MDLLIPLPMTTWPDRAEVLRFYLFFFFFKKSSTSRLKALCLNRRRGSQSSWFMLDLVSRTLPADFSAAHSYSTNPFFSSKRYYCKICGVSVVCVHVLFVCGSLRITSIGLKSVRVFVSGLCFGWFWLMTSSQQHRKQFSGCTDLVHYIKT